MKKILLILLFIFPTIVNAADFNVSVGQTLYGSDMIQNANSYKLTLSEKGVYIALERERFRMYGQDMGIDNLSVGYKYELKSPFYIYGQVGYYWPKYDSLAFGWEAIYIEQSKEYNYNGLYIMPIADHYRYDVVNGWGVEIGAGLKFQIYKSLLFATSVGYRYLRLRADYDGLDIHGAQYWIMGRQDSFDAVKIYGGLEIVF